MPARVRTLLGFASIGAVGVLGYVALSSALVATGLPPQPASLLSYGLFIPPMYLAQRGVAFRSRASHATAFPRYLATQIVGLSLAGLLPGLLHRIPPTASFVLVAAALPLVNFALLRFWTFRE